MKFKERVSIYYTSLTSTEKKICTKIFADPNIIINNSIVEAGKLCDTSKSAILRFCKKIGYRGYSEFKYDVEEYVKNQNSDDNLDKNSNLLSLITGSFGSTIQVLGNLDFDDKLKELSKDIDNYTYVKSVGIGNSSFPANQLVYSLYSHNKFFDVVNDDVQFSYLSNCLNDQYLLIIFSVSASADTYLKFMKSARSKGAKIYLITMNGEGDLLKYADTTFVLPSNVEPQHKSTILKQLDNRTTLYLFSEIISYYYGEYLEDKNKERN